MFIYYKYKNFHSLLKFLEYFWKLFRLIFVTLVEGKWDTS